MFESAPLSMKAGQWFAVEELRSSSWLAPERHSVPFLGSSLSRDAIFSFHLSRIVFWVIFIGDTTKSFLDLQPELEKFPDYYRLLVQLLFGLEMIQLASCCEENMGVNGHKRSKTCELLIFST